MLRWVPGLARLLLLWKPMLWQLTLPITAGSCSITPQMQSFSCWQPQEPDLTPSPKAALAALPVLLLYQLTVCSAADGPHRRLSAHAHQPRDWACPGYTVTWEWWKQRQQAWQVQREKWTWINTSKLKSRRNKQITIKKTIKPQCIMEYGVRSRRSAPLLHSSLFCFWFGWPKHVLKGEPCSPVLPRYLSS